MKKLISLLALLCLLHSNPSFADSKPTIVVFLSDDHGMLDSMPYGSADVRTPSMQRLADAGMKFTHAFIASPSCAPSRAAMLTGLMPVRNGAEANHAFKCADVPSLPEEMRKLGYETAAFGKVAHNPKDTPRHGSDHGAQWPFGKWNLYDASIRVPFLAAWPGVIKPGTSAAAQMQWIDLWPTLIEAAGGTVPAGIDGRSFLPVLRGEKAAHREVIFTTHSGDGEMNVYPIRSIRDCDWKLILNLHPEFAHTTHIDKSPKITSGLCYWRSWFEKAKVDPAAAAIVKRYHERLAMELYDLRGDPGEMRNLAGDPANTQRLAEMRARLDEWMREQGDRQTVFNIPRPLSDPASTIPAKEESDVAAPARNKIKAE